MAKKKFKPYDAVFVFGYGLDANGQLSELSKLNALAAGYSFAVGRTHTLILSGGTGGHNGAPSVAEQMQTYIRRRFGVRKDTFVIDSGSNETLESFMYLANLMDRHPAQLRLAYIALSAHLNYVREMAQLFDLVHEENPTEDLIASRSQRHRIYLEQRLRDDNVEYQALANRFQSELSWIRSQPDYWIPTLTALEDRFRLAGVLKRGAGIAQYLQENDINPHKMRDRKLRKRINALTRVHPLEQNDKN